MKLRDSQWKIIEANLADMTTFPGVKAKNNRLFIEAVILISKREIPWSALPACYGKWNTTYMRFRRWNEAGLWNRLENALRNEPDLHALLKQITAMGVRCEIFSVEKKLRKISKLNYFERTHDDSSPAQICAQAALFPLQNTEPNWVNLIADYHPRILPF